MMHHRNRGECRSSLQPTRSEGDNEPVAGRNPAGRQSTQVQANVQPSARGATKERLQ
jgi:hypothetical protein